MNGAFTLAEVIISLALTVIVVLTLLGLGLTALQGNRKSTDLVAGQMAAEQELRELLYDAKANATAPLWSVNSRTAPYQVDPLTLSGTTYKIYTYASDVTIVPPPYRGLKKVECIATWWDAPSGARTGYGVLQASASQFVNVP